MILLQHSTTQIYWKTLKFAFFISVGNSKFNSGKGSKNDVLSSSPLSDRIKGLWVVCGLHNCGTEAQSFTHTGTEFVCLF